MPIEGQQSAPGKISDRRLHEAAAFCGVTALCFALAAIWISSIEAGSLGVGAQNAGQTVAVTLSPQDAVSEGEAISNEPEASLATAPQTPPPPEEEIVKPNTIEHSAPEEAVPKPQDKPVQETGGAQPGSARAPAPPGARSGGAALSFAKTLYVHLKSFQRPSTLAPHGIVLLLVALQRDGRVMDIALLKSSGDAALDNEAIATVRRAQPLPPIPFDLPDRLSIAVPVDFSRS